MTVKDFPPSFATACPGLPGPDRGSALERQPGGFRNKVLDQGGTFQNVLTAGPDRTGAGLHPDSAKEDQV